MTFRGTSYALGQALGQVVFEAANSQAAVHHPRLRELPAGGQNAQGQTVRIVGVKLLRP